MQCTQIKTLVNEVGIERLKDQAPESVRQHIDSCEHCREYLESMRYNALLKRLPNVAPSEGFADRALQQAWLAKESRSTEPRAPKTWMLATAASLVLAIGVLFTLPSQDTSTGIGSNVVVVEVAPQEIRQVDLLMVSGQALENAFITLQMDEHVSLAGYPDYSTVRWATSIVAGNNQLTLPVQLRGSDSGSIVVEVESGGARKQMLLNVSAVSAGEQVALII